MKDVSVANFGLLIAYVLPGFIVLWGISFFSPTVSQWLLGERGYCATVGGFFYTTLASVTLGLAVNAIRWATIDAIHHRTGIQYPAWDFSKLQQNLNGYNKLVDIYYRYHESFGNLLIAGSFAYGAWRSVHTGWEYVPADFVFLLLAIVLWMSSRDVLTKYYRRVEQLLHQ